MVLAPNRMTDDDWNGCRPDRIGAYRLGEAIAAHADRAIFRAVAEDGVSPAPFVWLIEPQDEETDAARVIRFLEATFFHHPNVLKIHGAGRRQTPERTFIYVVS